MSGAIRTMPNGEEVTLNLPLRKLNTHWWDRLYVFRNRPSVNGRYPCIAERDGGFFVSAPGVAIASKEGLDSRIGPHPDLESALATLTMLYP